MGTLDQSTTPALNLGECPISAKRRRDGLYLDLGSTLQELHNPKQGMSGSAFAMSGSDVSFELTSLFRACCPRNLAVFKANLRNTDAVHAGGCPINKQI